MPSSTVPRWPNALERQRREMLFGIHWIRGIGGKLRDFRWEAGTGGIVNTGTPRAATHMAPELLAGPRELRIHRHLWNIETLEVDAIALAMLEWTMQAQSQRVFPAVEKAEWKMRHPGTDATSPAIGSEISQWWVKTNQRLILLLA